MREALLDHIWQSTLFALIAAVVVFAFRKNGAHIRFGIWFAASVKFLIPLSLLIFAGECLTWKVASTPQALPALLAMATLFEPAATMGTGKIVGTEPLMGASDQGMSLIETLILLIWVLGVVMVACCRAVQWWKFRCDIRNATRLAIGSPIPARETSTVLEPVVFGFYSPVLLFPVGISRQLTADELDAIVAHELCHWRRRDNLIAVLHMVIEALFWFHPIIWWVGARMIVERERACDEAVVRSGRSRTTYAEGILKVCRRQRTLACTAAVSGGSLTSRIESILTNSVPVSLHFGKRCLLGALGTLAVTGPVAVGLFTGSLGVVRAQTRDEVEMKHYESGEWKFGLDVPKRWDVLPPDLNNSLNEVVRFASREGGGSNLIIFRSAYDPNEGLETRRDRTQQSIADAGFSHFISGETTIGSRRVLMLEFDRPSPRTPLLWHCRSYFVVAGTTLYVLGFGTHRPDDMFPLDDRIARTFVSREVSE